MSREPEPITISKVVDVFLSAFTIAALLALAIWGPAILDFLQGGSR